MASEDSTTISNGSGSRFDEQNWVILIRRTLEDELEEEDEVAVSIFCVPKVLLACKPEAYTPQFIAIGPYHHWRPELFILERYKLTTARRTQKQLHGIKLGDLVDKFAIHDGRIRSYYDRFLDFSGEALTWMMLMDACFLIEFLQVYAHDRRTMPTKSHLVDHSGKKSTHNIILRDLVMIENQIPLFLLRKIMELRHSSTQEGDELLSKMLTGFAQEVSPLKIAKDFSSIDVSKYAHLLELIYHVLVPKPPKSVEQEPQENQIDVEPPQVNDTPSMEEALGDSSQLKQVCLIIWRYIPSLSRAAPVQFFKGLIVSRPVKFMGNAFKIVTNIPGISAFRKEDSKSEGSSSGTNNFEKPPLVEEILIPSVTELVNAGVRFHPTPNGELTTIKFDAKIKTLYLPAISLDVNAEVVLRNLVAYEAAVVPGSLVFTRYTELMNGIIDTEEDAKVLRRFGIVSNHMKSDGEVAHLWNKMAKSVRLTKVAFLDKTIGDVNRYYNSRWIVRSEKFMKRYVFGCWPLLTFLAAILLLLLNFLQAFCSVYTCANWLHIPDVGND